MNDNLKWQVCNLELAKKLKELGVKQESLWYWDFSDYKVYKEIGLINKYDMEITNNHISAFTCAELGEMLPDEIWTGNQYFITTYKRNDTYYVSYRYEDDIDSGILIITEAKTEADARAKMLIYLLENKLITNDPKRKNI